MVRWMVGDWSDAGAYGEADMRVLGRAKHVPHESCMRATIRIPLPNTYPCRRIAPGGIMWQLEASRVMITVMKLYWQCPQCNRWNGEHNPQCNRCAHLPRTRTTWSDRPGGTIKSRAYMLRSTERKRK
jgi:hypothetical protein